MTRHAMTRHDIHKIYVVVCRLLNFFLFQLTSFLSRTHLFEAIFEELKNSPTHGSYVIRVCLFDRGRIFLCFFLESSSDFDLLLNFSRIATLVDIYYQCNV